MEVLTKISDIVTSMLPQLMILLTSSGFMLFLVKFLGGLVLDKIRNKTKDKFSKPILTEIKQLRAEQKQIQEEQGKQIVELVKNAFEEEAERKRIAYVEIMNKQVDVPTQSEVVVDEKIEEPIVEEVVEKKEPTEYKVAKRVITDE